MTDEDYIRHVQDEHKQHDYSWLIALIFVVILASIVIFGV